MKKDGFTLIELLGVIVILGLIALVAIPVVLNQTKKSKEDLFKNQIELIKASTNTYVTDAIMHKEINQNVYNAVKNKTNTTITITLNVLQINGSVEYNISNPLCDGDKKYFSPDLKINIQYDGKEFKYDVIAENDWRSSCTEKRSLPN